MIYNFSISFHNAKYEKIETDTLEEAEQKAEELTRQFINELINRLESDKASPRDKALARLEESDENFKLKKGGIYLIRRYKSQVPAKCVESDGWGDFFHRFYYLDSQRYFRLKGKNPERVIRLLCEDGKINKPECETCVSKFRCFTKK